MPIKRILKKPVRAKNKVKARSSTASVSSRKRVNPKARDERIRKLKTARRRAGIDPATGTVTPRAKKLAAGVVKLRKQKAFKKKQGMKAAARKRKFLRAK
jgi:hypothetical protein